MTLTSRGILKWLTGSKSMTAASLPMTGIDGEIATGRIAFAIKRYSNDVLPDPVGWCAGGDETSSRIGGA